MFRAPWSPRPPRGLRPLETRDPAAAEPSARGRRPEGARTTRQARRPPPVTGRIEAAAFFLAAGVIAAQGIARKLESGAAAAPLGSGGSAGDRGRSTAHIGGILDLLSIHAGGGLAGQVRRAERSEPHRGRNAQSPADIPARGWRDVLARTWAEFNEDRIVSVAAGVTFFTLLSLFPAIGAFVSLYGLFADVGQAEKQLSLLRGLVPPGVLDFVGGEMVRIAAGRSGGLGVAFAVTLLISLWSANGAVKALFDGLNIAYEERESRGLVKLNLISFAFTLGALAFVALALVAVVVVPIGLRLLGLAYSPGAWVAELRWPALFLLSALGISVVYRYGPSRRTPRWRWITWGGGFAALLWLAASLLFSWYVANFAHYDKTYGSLGAVVGFMTWIWYSTIIILFGAELNSELEHQTAVDTTVGAPKPMGARGASMADTLGAVRSRRRKPAAAPAVA